MISNETQLDRNRRDLYKCQKLRTGSREVVHSCFLGKRELGESQDSKKGSKA